MPYYRASVFHELSHCLLNMKLITKLLSLKLLVSTNVSLELDGMCSWMRLQLFLRHFMNKLFIQIWNRFCFHPRKLTVTLEKSCSLLFVPDYLISTLLPSLFQSRTQQLFVSKDRTGINTQITILWFSFTWAYTRNTFLIPFFHFRCTYSLSIYSVCLVVVG